jgi:predicted nucleotidyltransferase
MQNLDIYRRHYQARQERIHQTQLQRQKEGICQAQALARYLKESYGVSEVWLFGSLLNPASVHEESDIDLGCRGLEPLRYFGAVGDLLCRAKGFEVDLVMMEQAQVELCDAIKEGIQL